MDDNAPAGGPKPRLVGINHVALEVGDVEEALAFYGRIFEFTLRGKGEGQAFIDMGDQFIALLEMPTPHKDAERHFGLVVDDRSAVRERAARAGATLLDGPFLDFLDPWGNRVQVVAYATSSSPRRPRGSAPGASASRRASKPGASSPTGACSRASGEA